ncbi:hypothetical protein HC256_004545 [Beauveria bassiana]|nr:hypothetical protein HC256_004545 [Beauveria bassiana]
MCLIVQRAWRRTSTRPHRVAATQRRFKTFERRVDKNEDVYYTIAKRRPVQAPDVAPSSEQFFEMPNLLLDLDAEGTRSVRTFDDKDEELQFARWRINPKREEVKLTLDVLEAKLIELRKRSRDVAANSLNIWKLTSHDILSAALHGPLESDSAVSTEHQCPDTLEGSRMIDVLRRENGIPSHVNVSSTLLLEWMLLRRYSIDKAKGNMNEATLSSTELVEALQEQSSIIGIRRLLRQNLWTFASFKAHFNPANREADNASDVAGKVRKRCIEILDSENAHQNQITNCLALVGSLLERLSKVGMEPDHRLQGLALRAASRSGSLVVLSEWIRRTHVSSGWEKSLDIVQDATACMQNCSRLLATQPGTAVSRQLLLQLLTGLNEHERLAPESLRSVSLSSIGRNTSNTAIKQACEAFAKLLGELGAVRTLLKESESACKSLREACIDILKGTPKYSETLKTQGVKALSIEECVVLDYHDIAE